MSFVPREERARRSRQAQFANGQRPGGSDVDPRQRRSSEAELQTSQRVGDGQEVDANGRAQVRKDNTITVDSRNRHAVVADNLRFETPVEGSQAATKAYVDERIGLAGTAFRTQTDWDFDTAFASTVPPTVMPCVPGSDLESLEIDQGNLLSQGTNGIVMKGGHTYLVRASLSVISAGTLYHQGRMGIGYSNTSGVLIPLYRTVRANQNQRTLWTVESAYTATEETEAVIVYYATSAGVGWRAAYPQLTVQRVEPYVDEDETAALPGLYSIVAEFIADTVTAATLSDIYFYDQSYNDTATAWSWTFGDGTTSTVQNPVKQYASAGTYTVSLTVTGSTGSDTETKTSYITVT